MTIVFDGREFARKKELGLKEKVETLKAAGLIPKLVSIIVGEDPASVMYVNLKKKAAERIGCELEVRSLKLEVSKEEIKKTIEENNNDSMVTGIMVQLPLPKNFSKDDRDEILATISPQKDVDGLRDDSKFTAPTAKAVLEVLHFALSQITIHRSPFTVCVVGASGMEGRRIVKALKQEYKQSLAEQVGKNIGIKGIRLEIHEAGSKTKSLTKVVKNADVVISVTGVPDLIKADMVKEGAILIDVGSPKGDIERAAYEKASFVSPVPGGVGPITISCLLENLVII